MPRTDEVTAGLPEATRDLVVAVRELMTVAATTQADLESIELAGKAVAELSRSLGVDVRSRTLRTPFESIADGLETGRPWTLGDYNPWAVPMEIQVDGDTATARLVAGALQEGPPESVHGGFSSHLMDCMLGSLLMARGIRAVTANLDVRYRHRTPLDEPLDLSAEIVGVAGRKVRAVGRITHGDVVCVEAAGLFVALEETP